MRTSAPGSAAAPRRPTASTGYRPALDGVRALAVVAVLVYHGLPDAAPGGFLGVDVFFVLSGYLITSLLVREMARTGRIGLAAFWSRRARRLLPALLVVCGAICLLTWWYPRLVDVARLRGDVVATLGYVVNWRFLFSHQDYFAQFAQPSLLRHAWSLAIEEQFYLVWPLAVAGLLVWRHTRPSRLAVGCAVAAGASAAWMAVLAETGASTSRLYYGTDTRAQALLVGAALGAAGAAGAGRIGHRRIGDSRAGRRIVDVAGVVGLAGILASFVLVTDRSPPLYRGGFLLAALFAVGLVADASRAEPSRLGRMLGVAPLVALGTISYGVYLWHWPIDVVVTRARTGVGGLALLSVRVTLTLALAALSYHVIEMPIRRGALGRWRAWIALPIALGTVTAGAVVLGADTPRTFVAPVSGRELRVAPAAAPTTAGPAGTGGPGPEVSAPPTRVLVVGDSVALTLGVGLDFAAAGERLSVSDDGILGCGILLGGEILVDGTWAKIGANCQQWPDRWAADVAMTSPQVVIVLTGTWDAFDRRIDGRVVPFGTAEADGLIRRDLQRATDVLSSRGAHVLLLTTPYITKENDPNPPARYQSAFDRSRVDHFNALLREAVAGDPRADVVDLNSFLAPGGHPRQTLDGTPLQPDGVHLGPDGGAVVAKWLAPYCRTGAAKAESVGSR